MQAEHSIDYSLSFASPLSPWWLALLMPLAVALVFWWYRGQFEGIARLSRKVLRGLRIV
ncbi:MAG: hypothetical protein HQL31_14000, partial [Planctomycetes bacterium]|nr:hypothetical protein [Planctomycetota bacterium]